MYARARLRRCLSSRPLRKTEPKHYRNVIYSLRTINSGKSVTVSEVFYRVLIFTGSQVTR